MRGGGNHVWPEIEAKETADGMVAPIRVYDAPIAPGGWTFVRAEGSPWRVFGALTGRTRDDQQPRRARDPA